MPFIPISLPKLLKITNSASICHLLNFRYVYKFVCDLQSLLGYSPEELQAMVAQQQQQQQQQQQSTAVTPVSSLEQSLHESPGTPIPQHALKREAD